MTGAPVWAWAASLAVICGLLAIDMLTTRSLDTIGAAPINEQAKAGLSTFARLAANRSA